MKLCVGLSDILLFGKCAFRPLHQDKDVTEASGHIADLAGRLRDLETSLTDSRSQENKLMRDLEENKRRYREARHEVTHLKGT